MVEAESAAASAVQAPPPQGPPPGHAAGASGSDAATADAAGTISSIVGAGPRAKRGPKPFSATNQPKKRTRGVGSRTLGHTYIEDRAKRRILPARHGE